jgi:hypothetical protein
MGLSPRKAWPAPASDDVCLCQRGVVAAICPEYALQAMGGTEYTANTLQARKQLLWRVGDVLSEDPNPLVFGHHLVKRSANRLAEVDEVGTRL